MNKLLAFFKMHPETSFTSSLPIEDAVRILRENTNMNPDMPVNKSERDKYMFIAYDKIHPSLNAIIPNMHMYSMRKGLLTPVLNVEFSSQDKSGSTTVKIKAKPDPNTGSIRMFEDIICLFFGLISLLLAFVTNDFRYLYIFAFSLIWVPFGNLLGFWTPYRYVMNDLEDLLKKEN